MKVTFVLNDTGMAGGVRIALHFADQLRHRGHDVRLVSLPRQQLPRWSRTKAQVKRTLKAVLDPVATLKGLVAPRRKVITSHLHHFPPFDHRELEAYRPVVDADVPDADVVIATWWETALMVADLAPSKGAKISFFQQFDANFGQPVDQVERAWRLPTPKIVCSQWLADLAVERFGDPTAVVVNNGMDFKQFDAPPRGKQAVPTVGMMYSPAPPKDLPSAVAVLAATRERFPDLRVLAFGMLHPLDVLPLPPGSEFEYLPDQDRIRATYAQCDAWLCTSSSEGFHLPPHEAMACRTPVVSTRVGGPMDMITDGVNGFLAEPYDRSTLTNRLAEVLAMPDDRWRAMSDAAYTTARGYTWDRAGAEFEAALEAAVARGRSEPAAAPA